MFNRQVLLSTFAAVALLATAQGALAADMETKQLQVSFRGLALNTPAGEAGLRARVSQAANSVCGWADSRDLKATADVAACRKAAIFQAMSQVDLVVASAHARQTVALTAAR